MFNFVKSLMFNPAPVHYMVDSDYRTVAQGWARPDQTGPLDLWAVRNPGYVYRTGDYTNDSVALQAANDALVDFRGDMIFFTPGAYSLGTAIAVDVAAARWLGTAYKSPTYGCAPAVRGTTITATVADVFADGAAETMRDMEVGWLNFVPLTAEDIWNLSAVQTGIYFHDFIFDTVSVGTSAATQFLVSAGIQTEQVFDQFSWYSIAPQGPVFEMATPSNVTISNFQHIHYDTGGTYAVTLLDLTGVTVDGVFVRGGRGLVSDGAGAGLVTALITLAAQTTTTQVLFVDDFRGSIDYATASSLITVAGDAGESVMTDCWLALADGSGSAHGTAYSG